MKKIASAAGLAALFAIATLSSAEAASAWGCAATNGAGLKGRSGGYDTVQGARQRALTECETTYRRGDAACHILGCHTGIFTKTDADRYWPMSGKW